MKGNAERMSSQNPLGLAEGSCPPEYNVAKGLPFAHQSHGERGNRFGQRLQLGREQPNETREELATDGSFNELPPQHRALLLNIHKISISGNQVKRGQARNPGSSRRWRQSAFIFRQTGQAWPAKLPPRMESCQDPCLPPDVAPAGGYARQPLCCRSGSFNPRRLSPLSPPLQ
jgi:hypothetical protein